MPRLANAIMTVLCYSIVANPSGAVNGGNMKINRILSRIFAVLLLALLPIATAHLLIELAKGAYNMICA